MKEYSVIGKRLPNVHGVAKATGEADYTGDIVLPGMLYGKILRSPYPHAKILHIDTSKAEKLAGVRAVVTSKDTPGIGYSEVESPQCPPDKFPFAMDRVRYIGDEVAAVAAIDEEIAEEALDLIKVEYEELPAVFDPEEAMKPDAPKIYDYAENNICSKISWEFGDVENGFSASDLIREDEFKTARVTHCAMEPHLAIAVFDSSGKLTVWSSNQNPFMRRAQLAKLLAMPISKIRIITPHVGGGFGGKTVMCDPEIQAVFLSQKAGRTVKITYTREEVFAATTHRHPSIINLKTGVKKDGTLVALQCRLLFDGGAYTASGPWVIWLAGQSLLGTCRIPNIKFDGYRVFTNNPVCGAQRGFGAPQPSFALNSQLDMIAEDLGMDMVELRLKNATHAGDKLPNMRVTSCGLSECIQKAAESADWKKKRGKMSGRRGIGMAAACFVSGVYSPPHKATGAFVKINEDGGVDLMTGVTEIGQGSDTILSQIVADELGIYLDDVRITSGDTDVTPPHAGSFSSRGTLWGGKAVKAAAADAKRQLFEVVADKLEARLEDLEARDRRICVTGSPERGISFSEAVMTSYLSREGNPILGRGHYKPPFDHTYEEFEKGIGNVSPAYSFEAQIAEVEVDVVTGKVKVLKMTVAHDCGLIINPMAVEGQVEGSIYMGLGQTLTEEIFLKNGRGFNSSFMDYKLPTVFEVPEIKTILVETTDPEDSFAPKEAGESMQIATLAAIANAIYDAVGVRVKEIPITPEKILKALKKNMLNLKKE